MNAFDAFLSASLGEIEAAGLRRSLLTVSSAQGPEIICEGRRMVNFSSNDYLGLAAHPRLREAAIEALAAGTGVGASRLICGTHVEHERLEQALARFKQTEAALSFSSGYAAALGAIPALVGEGDVIVLDKLCHACLVDGARLSGSILRVFPHNHLEKLEGHLRWARQKYPQSRVLVLAESVYSMDGDLAPLAEMVELKERYGAWLMLDEAHGVGVLGRNGRGLAAELGLTARIEVQMGTLGKALGSSGAYLCGSAALRDYLINRARSFIFSTAPAPAGAAASRAAVELMECDEGEALRQKLWRNIAVMGPGASAIFPILIGDERQAVEASLKLREQGMLVPAIRYPTVARGSARLRVSLSASHEPSEIRALQGTVGSPTPAPAVASTAVAPSDVTGST